MAFFDEAIVGSAAFMENLLELPYGNGRCFFVVIPCGVLYNKTTGTN